MRVMCLTWRIGGSDRRSAGGWPWRGRAGGSRGTTAGLIPGYDAVIITHVMLALLRPRVVSLKTPGEEGSIRATQLARFAL